MASSLVHLYHSHALSLSPASVTLITLKNVKIQSQNLVISATYMQTHFGLLADSHVLRVGIVSDGDSYLRASVVTGLIVGAASLLYPWAFFAGFLIRQESEGKG